MSAAARADDARCYQYTSEGQIRAGPKHEKRPGQPHLPYTNLVQIFLGLQESAEIGRLARARVPGPGNHLKDERNQAADDETGNQRVSDELESHPRVAW